MNAFSNINRRLVTPRTALRRQKNRITAAVLLAAGTGSRLQPLTDNSPKCLTEVNGITILERLVRSLQAWGVDRLFVVVGHLDCCIRDFLGSSVDGLTIEYIWCSKYRTTNNIYSLWEARHAIDEPFLLVECDLIFDAALLGKMLVPDRIAVSRIEPWMNGTTVSLNSSHHVTQFQMDGDRVPDELTYKTVNIYSFSRPSWQRVKGLLEQYVSTGQVNAYYEAVFAEMVDKGNLSLEAVFFDEHHWHEIDTLDDLNRAEQLFLDNNEHRAGSVLSS
jgi:choline kinase